MLRTLLKATSILSLVFAGFHGAFVALARWMHEYAPPTDAALVNRWMRDWVVEHDGIESQVMLVGVMAFLGLGYLVASRLDRVPWFRHPISQALCLVPALVIVGSVRSSNFTPLAGATANLMVVGFTVALILSGYAACRLTESRPLVRRLLLGGGGLLVGAGVLLAAQPAEVFDYGFFIGPALKLAAGEPLGSFYIQYNLIGTYLFRALMTFGLKAHQMQAVLGLIFVLWLWLYYRLASRLIESRFVVFLFMLGLLVVRFLAIDGGPAAYPQASTLRMDLWVPLALALLRFGFASPLTSAAFSLGYLADNLFGFLFFALYAVALAGTLVRGWRQGRRPSSAAFGGLCAPMLAVVAFELSTFGSLTNPAGKMYQSVHLGFLPIERTSMFWGVAWLLFLAMFPIAHDSSPARRRTSLFLFAFAAAQLLYFYGRSHDHNLLNLSGIWLLIVFVGMDRLRHRGCGARGPALAAGLFVCLASVAAAGSALPKLELIRSRLARGVVFEPIERDLEIDRAPDLFAAYPRKDRVYLFSECDAYLNYRYGLPQLGYFSPLQAAVFADSTAAMVHELIVQGYTVVLYGAPPEDLTDLNSTPSMTESRQLFALVPTGGPLTEVRLAPRER